MNHSASYFDSMFSSSDDPWKFRTRWYEKRKRAMTLAALPANYYEYAYEPGCANGELAAALAERCEQLLISDGSAKAVTLARKRLKEFAHVDVQQAWLPQEWPDSKFDLIVFSELGYFLSVAQLQLLIGKMQSSLRPHSNILACHWRHPTDDCELDGDDVHQLMRAELNLPLIMEMHDTDFRIDVWGTDYRSVAQKEGFV